MKSYELLSWFGNILNFAVVIYLIRITFGTSCFSVKNILISAGALLVSVLINFYVSLKNVRNLK